MDANPTYLSREQAATLLHLKPKTLANCAAEGKGPRFLKAGGKRVLYALGDLEAWLKGQLGGLSPVPDVPGR